jgi:energy-coupling factor transporter ATP-binding protein EcfA2
MNFGMSVLFQAERGQQLTVEQEPERCWAGEGRLGFFRRDPQVVARMYEVLRSLDPSIPLGRRVAELSVAQKQVIEIAKAIASESELIIMDEPTAALSEEEVNRLFTIIKELKMQNVTVISSPTACADLRDQGRRDGPARRPDDRHPPGLGLGSGGKWAPPRS